MPAKHQIHLDYIICRYQILINIMTTYQFDIALIWYAWGGLFDSRIVKLIASNIPCNKLSQHDNWSFSVWLNPNMIHGCKQEFWWSRCVILCAKREATTFLWGLLLKIWVWISNRVHCFVRAVITYPWPKLNSDLRLLGYGWGIAPHCVLWGLITYPFL